MDDASRIETYKQALRVRYASDVTGLRKLVASLTDTAGDPVVITQQGFEGGQASGALVLEPMAKLAAALAVLSVLDPTGTPPAQRPARYASFCAGRTET